MPPPLRGHLDRLALQLDQIERTLSPRAIATNFRVDDIRRQLIDIERTVLEIKTGAQIELRRARQLLDALGPLPDEKAPPETADIARLRTRLTEAFQDAQALVKETDWLFARVNAIETQLAAGSRAEMKKRLLEQATPLFQKDLWIRAEKTLVNALSHLPGILAQTGEARRDLLSPLSLSGLFFVVAATFIAFLFSRLLIARWGQQPDYDDPSRPRRITAALITALRHLIPFSIAALSGMVILTWASGRFSAPLIWWEAGMIGLGAALLLSDLAKAVLSPAPAWRVFALDSEASRKLRGWLQTAAVLLGLYLAFERLRQNWRISDIAIEQIWIAALAGGLAILLFKITDRRLWASLHPPPPGDGEDAPESATAVSSSRLWPTVALALRLAALVALLAAVAGFHNLASFVTEGLLLTALGLAFFHLLSLLLREGLPLAAASSHRLTASGRARFPLTVGQAEQLAFWTGLFFQSLLALLATLGLLLIWGVPWYEIADGFDEISHGFTIGSAQIRPADLGIALLIFTAGWFVTRTVKNALKRKFLPHTGLDQGVRDSIVAGIGYLGIVIAAGFVDFDLRSRSDQYHLDRLGPVGRDRLRPAIDRQ